MYAALYLVTDSRHQHKIPITVSFQSFSFGLFSLTDSDLVRVDLGGSDETAEGAAAGGGTVAETGGLGDVLGAGDPDASRASKAFKASALKRGGQLPYMTRV
jgi:hypothetical protein